MYWRKYSESRRLGNNGFDPQVGKKTEPIHTVIFLPLYDTSFFFSLLPDK